MNIGIVGAGIMGRLLALALIDAGHQVSLYDKDSETNCSMAAAGMLAPVSELIKSDKLIYDLGCEALQQHWPEIIKNLGEDIYFRQQGSVVVSHPQDKAEMTNMISMIDERMETAVYQRLSKDELTALEPELTKFNEAYFFPEEGQIDNQALMCALKTRLDIADISELKSKYDMMFDCRGLGAASVFPNLQAVRGELIWLHAPDVNIQRPIRFMHPRYNLYIAPRPDNIYLLGATEIYANDHSPISVRSALELLTAAFYLHSGFAEARIIKTVTHCRPAFPHHLPKIKYSDGCIAVNGLYRHGFLIAPSLVAEILRYMEKGKMGLQYPQIWEFE